MLCIPATVIARIYKLNPVIAILLTEIGNLQAKHVNFPFVVWNDHWHN